MMTPTLQAKSDSQSCVVRWGQPNARPPIARDPVATTPEDLGRHIVGGADDRERLLATAHVAPSEHARSLLVVALGCRRVKAATPFGHAPARIFEVNAVLVEELAAMLFVVGAIVRELQVGCQAEV